jgi:hypothetical protein
MVELEPRAPLDVAGEQPSEEGLPRIPWAEIAFLVVGVRLLLTVIAAMGASVVKGSNVTGSPQAFLLEPWRYFDALRFITIASHGYGADPLNTAYLPLYPLAIRLGAVLTLGHYLTAALLVSNLACLGAMGLLWRWIAGIFDRTVAWRAVILILLFPDGFFLFGAYSESLFLLLSAGCLLAIRTDRLLLAGGLATLATLTRVQGLMLLAPLFFATLRSWPRASERLTAVISLLLAPLMLLIYQQVLVARLGGGDVATTLRDRWHIMLQPPWQTLRQYIDLIRSPAWHLIDSPQANYVMLWDLTIALVVLGALCLGARRLGLELTVFGLLSWTIALSRWYSTGRYMLAVIPFFLVVALWARGSRLRWVATVSLVLLVFFTAEFAQGSWID